jgi:DNA-binding CsgD family transcriptional regulator
MKDVAALDDALRGYPQLRPLTVREIEIMEYVVQAYTHKEIGVALGIATGTVRHHLYIIRAKLQVKREKRKALIAAYLATRET